jgi:probable HAF family extracellular repeat protein
MAWLPFFRGNFISVNFPGSTGTGPYGVNSAGQIVGKYFTDNGDTHGFLAVPIRNRNRNPRSAVPIVFQGLSNRGALARAFVLFRCAFTLFLSTQRIIKQLRRGREFFARNIVSMGSIFVDL